MDPPSDPDGANATGRPTGRRVHGHQVTARDVDILRWIARHGVVTAEQAGRRFFWHPERNAYGKWATYHRLAALERMRLVIRARSYGYPLPVLRVTREGARIADVGLRPAPLVHRELRHTIALVKLVEDLAASTGAEPVTERELRAERYREQRSGDRETGEGRTPDAVLRVQRFRDGYPYVETVAIELDLSRKDNREIERIVRAYDREQVDRVWWFVRGVRVEHVRKVVRELRAEDRIEVRQWLE